jgi:hypothetical protein
VWLGGLSSLYLGCPGGPGVVTETFVGWVLALVALGCRRVVRRSDGLAETALGPYLCHGAVVAMLGYRW